MKAMPEPLDPREVAEIDERYRPFPPFRDWPQEFADHALWDEAVRALKESSVGVDDEALDAARGKAIRAASLDTGAIEGLYETDRGLTRTVAEQAAAWERTLSQREPGALSFFQAQLRTYELVLDAATGQMPKITQAWIRRLHEELTEPQDTYVVHTPSGPQEQQLPRGRYKEHPNHVQTADGVHAYAPVDQTQAEMERFVDEVSSPSFANADPVIQASYAHYALVAVHPFADGNGRVARALASAFSYRAASTPLLILVDQRDAYFEALADADRGNPDAFVAFVAWTARGAVELVMQTLESAKAPNAVRELEALRGLRTAVGDLTHAQLDEIGVRVLNDVVEVASERISELPASEGISVDVQTAERRIAKGPPGFRPIVKPKGLHAWVTVTSAAPAEAQSKAHVFAFVANTSDAARAVAITADHSEATGPVTLALADVSPRVSLSATLRIEAFVDQLLGVMLSEVGAAAREALRRSGYRP